MRAVTLTVWGDKAAAITDASVGAVLAVKGARVGDFGGRSISTTMSSNVVENPKVGCTFCITTTLCLTALNFQVPEADKLRAWWESSGSTAAVTSISK